MKAGVPMTKKWLDGLRTSDDESGIERAQSSAGSLNCLTCNGGIMQQRSKDVKLNDGVALCDKASGREGFRRGVAVTVAV